MPKQRHTDWPRVILAMLIAGILMLAFVISRSYESVGYDPIGRTKAIESAIEFARRPHLVLLGDPEIIQARLTVLKEAVEVAKGSGDLADSDKFPFAPVWLVHVIGKYQVQGGPKPTQAPLGQESIPAVTPSPFQGQCYVIVDALTAISFSKSCTRR